MIPIVLLTTLLVAEDIPPSQVTVSSQYSPAQAAANIANGSGMTGETHDRHPGAHTMWHTAARPAPTPPAPGLPPAAAWARFDFAAPRTLTEVRIWNHNQDNLTTRGFRHSRLYGTPDGATWLALGERVELARGGDAAQVVPLLSGPALKALLIAAEDNWGDPHFGLSEVRFIHRREVPVAELPVPDAIALTEFPFSWDDAGKPHRQVTVSLGDTPLHEAAEVTVRCAGATAVTRLPASPAGARSITVPLPAGKADTRSAAAMVEATVATPRWSRSARAAIKPATTLPNLEEVVVIIKTHFDIGYTHRVSEIVHHYRTGMIDQAMSIMDSCASLPPAQRFAWTGPGWVMSKVFDDWDGQTPERRARLDEYVRTGKFQFHALPFTLESDACEPEEMARGFSFTSQLCRRYGMPLPRSGKMTDVPSHGGALATVLAHGGVKFMHIGCNWPSGNVKTPGLFWWEGPDGSRVLTFYSSTYGTTTGFGWPEHWGANELYVGRRFIPPANWPHRVWPAIIVTMDNSGPPKPEQVRAAFDEAARLLPGVRVRMGTFDDFAEALLADRPDLPVVRGEMPDTWIHGVGCDPGGSKLNRATRPRLAAAETLHTQFGLWGLPQPDVSEQIAHAYENILLYGEHTWGGAAAVQRFGEAFRNLDPKSYAALEASWEDKTEYIRAAARTADELTTANLAVLAAEVTAPAGAAIVCNPLPWPRSGTVEINGAPRFVKDVPPCGYLTLDPAPAGQPADAPALESPFYRLTLDPATGAVSSLIDKRTGREWVDPSSGHQLGQYLNERFTFEQTHRYTMTYQQGRAGDWPHPGMHKPGMVSEKQTPYRAATSARGAVRIDRNSAIIECPADPANHLPASSLRVTLSQDQPYLDLEITLHEKPKDNWPEADWLCLPFKLSNPRFLVHRQLGAIDPATDIVDGANRDLLAVGHGVTLTDDDGAGVAICPLDHTLVSLDRPGCWRFSKTAAEFTPRQPVVWLNLYNNQWNTNFRYWYPGTWSSRVRLWTFDAGTPAAARIAVPALEARHPLAAVTATGKGSRLPATRAGLTVSRPGVPVTAFLRNPDGPGTLLRVWEMAGNGGELTVTLPPGFTTATPVNLRGEPTGDALPVRNNRIDTPLPAYAPASFVLQ